jgi:Fic family protein
LREFDYRTIDAALLTPEIMNLVAKVHEYKGQQALFLTAKADILDAMLSVAKIQSTGASNRIEGIYTSEARLEQLVAHRAEPLNRDEAEIAGYREVLSTIHDHYEHITITPGVILQLHRGLYGYHPSAFAGKYKNQDNDIEEIDESGSRRVRFKALSAFATPGAVEKLCLAYREAVSEGRIDALLLIAKFVLDFLCIHPFNDGNGRLSRLLTLLLLYQQGYAVGKYISLEAIIERSKESYYESLKQSSYGWHENKSSYHPFVTYYLGVLLKAYKTFAERVEPVAVSKLGKSARVRALFDKRLGKISKSDIVSMCPDISATTIEKALADLLKEGYINKIGSGRATAYVLNRRENGEA